MLFLIIIVRQKFHFSLVKMYVNFKKNMKPYFTFIKDSTIFFAAEMRKKEDSLVLLKVEKQKDKKDTNEVSKTMDILLDEESKKTKTDRDKINTEVETAHTQKKGNEKDNKDPEIQVIAQQKFEESLQKNNQKATQAKKSPKLEALKQKAEEEKAAEEAKKEYLSQSKLDSISPFLGTLKLTATQGEALIKRGKNLGRNVKSFLRVNERQDASDEKKIIRYMIEVHSKITLALACIVLFLIGAPLGALIRKGGLGLPMVMAILFFVIFHIISTMGKKFAEEMVLSPFAGMWLSTAILFPFGLYLLYLANNDKQIVDFSFYTDAIKALFRKIVYLVNHKGLIFNYKSLILFSLCVHIRTS